jgi:hypothetical protein
MRIRNIEEEKRQTVVFAESWTSETRRMFTPEARNLESHHKKEYEDCA